MNDHPKYKVRKSQWYYENKSRIRDSQSVKKYGVTVKQKHELLAAQGGKCMLCEAPVSFGHNKAGKACLDHSHVTGEVRGVLCQKCNVGLGMFRDSPSTLRRAAEYVEERFRGQ